MVSRRRIGSAWDRLGRTNAFGAILTRDGKIAEWNADDFWTTGRVDAERFMNELSTLAPNAPRTRALDFGCGVGRVTQALAQYYSEVVGVDVASSMIKRARSLTPGNALCSFVLNRRFDLRRFESNSFAAVYCRLVLQHVEPHAIRRYIPELVRVLEPGGVLMFQLPEPVERTDPLRAFQQAPVVGGRLKRAIPRRLVAFWRWMKFQFIPKTPEPLMGRFGLPRDEVIELVKRSGGQIVTVRADNSHGDSVSGFVYWVTRRI